MVYYKIAMGNEGPPRSTHDLFAAICTSARENRLRDYRRDSALLLDLEGISWTCISAPGSTYDKPSLIVANHFARKPWQRGLPFHPKNSFTTRESFITTALIAKEAGERSEKPVTWMVQADLPERVFSFTMADRQTQQAIIKCYGLIPVGSNRGFEVVNACHAALYRGINVGIYPEGQIGHKLKVADERFEKLLTLLQRKKVDFQILPVSLFFEGDEFKLKIANPIEPKGQAGELVHQTMRVIADALPAHLHGAYA